MSTRCAVNLAGVVDMILVFILTWILQSTGEPDAIALWHWFGSHILLTLILLIFLG